MKLNDPEVSNPILVIIQKMLDHRIGRAWTVLDSDVPGAVKRNVGELLGGLYCSDSRRVKLEGLFRCLFPLVDGRVLQVIQPGQDASSMNAPIHLAIVDQRSPFA